MGNYLGIWKDKVPMGYCLGVWKDKVPKGYCLGVLKDKVPMGYCLGVLKDKVPMGNTVKDDSAKRASIGDSFTRRHMGQFVFIQLTVKP